MYIGELCSVYYSTKRFFALVPSLHSKRFRGVLCVFNFFLTRGNWDDGEQNEKQSRGKEEKIARLRPFFSFFPKVKQRKPH